MKYKETCYLLLAAFTLLHPSAFPAFAADQAPIFYAKGERRVYDRPPFGTNGNLVANPSFGDAATGWHFPNLADNRGKPLYSLVKYGDKSWVRIDQESATGNGKQGMVEQTLAIPPRLRNDVLEVSFLVSGLFTGFRIAGDGADFVFNTKIDRRSPERIYYYYHPDGAAFMTLSFLKGYPGQSVAGEYCEITEVAVREATWSDERKPNNLPATGGTLQLARWLKNWDEKSQQRQLANIRKLGGVVRVWLSAELFGASTDKRNPKKRNSPNLSPHYSNATTAKLFTGLDPSKVKQLDWFFEAARQHGLKVIVTLFGGVGEVGGTPLTYLGVPLSLEFLDTDPDIGNGFNQLAAAVVSRYARYDNVAAWELVNEGWSTWRGAYAGYSSAAPYSKDRALSFAGYRGWEKSAYATVKAADAKKRPVLLNQGSSDTLFLLNSDDVCDWSGVSLYLGAIRINSFSGSPSVFAVSQKTNTLANRTPVRAYTNGSFPTGINGSTTYYLADVTKYGLKIATTPGGPAVQAAGGSGTLFFYSTDGTSLAAFDNIFQRWADFPKPTVVAEMGAPNEVGNLYRNDTYEAAYLREGYKRVKKYGFLTGIVFDEFPAFGILWDQEYKFNQSGKAVESVGPTLFQQ